MATQQVGVFQQPAVFLFGMRGVDIKGIPPHGDEAAKEFQEEGGRGKFADL